MKKKRKINPISTEEYFLGGMLKDAGGKQGMAGGIAGLGGMVGASGILGNSVGGKTASGALSGAASGAMLGPLGIGAGALIGGISSFIGAKKEKEEALKAEQDMKNMQFSNFISSSNLNQTNGSNMPMAYGGDMYSEGGAMSPLFTEFEGGGTHEQNPFGGIPQGMNAEGKQRSVEEGETKFKFKEGEYIFSNRLSPLSYDF